MTDFSTYELTESTIGLVLLSLAGVSAIAWSISVVFGLGSAAEYPVLSGLTTAAMLGFAWLYVAYSPIGKWRNTAE